MRMMSFWKYSFVPLTVLVLVGLIGSGCGDSGAGGDFGATPGGVQDMSLARELIKQGVVPPAEAFLPEAMFSEHDLPLAGPKCVNVLCLRASLGLAPDSAGDPAVFAQVGMSSSIDPDTYDPPSMTIIATVDVSGSMGWTYGEDTPGEISRALLHQVAGQLRQKDQIAIVTYGSSVHTELPLSAGNSQAVDQVIKGLRENGSTNMEAGLKTAYALAENALGSTDEVRVMLFTDVQPNVGATSATDFLRLVEDGTKKGIGITVLGVGAGLGAELFEAMSHLRGGNAFALMKADDVDTFMEDHWPWAASPIAYDMTMTVTPSDNLEVARTYGFPGAEANASLGVATVFLSKRRGALLVELSPEPADIAAGDGVRLDLAYKTQNGETVRNDLSATYDGEDTDGRGYFFPQPSVAKTVALALLVDGMRRAAELYSTSQAEAIVLLTSTLERFVADAHAIADPAIDGEATFWPRLLELMEQGAEQGTLYGGYM